MKEKALVINWPKIDEYVHEYVQDYEMIGDKNDVMQIPSESEREMIEDCIRGLLADKELMGMLNPKQQADASPDVVTAIQAMREWFKEEFDDEFLGRMKDAGLIACVDGYYASMLASMAVLIEDAAHPPAVAVPDCPLPCGWQQSGRRV